MKNTSNIKASRPGEYMALFVIEVPTAEGIGHAFIACDDYSQYAIFTGVEKNQDDTTVLKHINLLMENDEFTKHRNKGFTLVLNDFKELSVEIEQIITPLHGKLLYDGALHNRITRPVKQSLYNS